jgi:phospholipid/cholesterol/gamma-HCH transport system permease protein
MSEHVPSAPSFTLDTKPTGDAGAVTLRLQGAWRLQYLADIERSLATTDWLNLTEVDASGLTQLDSAAALMLLRALPAAGSGSISASASEIAPRWTGLDASSARILAQVQAHLAAPPAPAAAPSPGWLAVIGQQAHALFELVLGHVNFLGQTLFALGELLTGKRRLRVRELSAQIQQTGLDAVPVVALVTMLIGVVFTYLLGLQSSRYGANIFVVDGVAIGTTREFSPIIVAIVVAGRSGAAFTAQLGSMRLTEEIDAIQTLGLSPQQVLVLPRVLALMITLPLLVFVGDVAAIFGSMAIAGPMLDINPSAYADRLRGALELKHLLIGLAKAPVFALVVAIIGTRMGMTVGRDTRAVGAATTSTVVQSIVAVILLDALFAVLLQALDL